MGGATLTLDLVQTVAFAGLILFLGYGLRKLIPPLARVNIPAPVCGGLPLAAVLAVMHSYGYQPLAFTTTLQVPLQNTFFASIGFAASLALLRRGGPLVLAFFMIALVVAALQNVVGSAVAWMLGQHPLMGVLAGSVTLTGGPATGLAFAPLFEQAGVPGAATLAVAAAFLGHDNGAIFEKKVRYFDGLVKQPTRIIAQIEHQPTQVATGFFCLLVKAVDCIENIFGGMTLELL